MPFSSIHRLGLGASLVGLLAFASLGSAATVLFDFETDGDLQRLHDEHKTTLGGGKTLTRVEQLATSGRFALRFAVPKWKQGLPQWPAFEADPPVTDWSKFDRLAFEVTNATALPQTLALFISDSKVPTRKGLSHQVKLAPLSFAPVVIPLGPLAAKKVNRADVRVLHFFTSEAPGDMALFIDRVVLLAPGEAVPAVSPAFVRDFAAVGQQRVESLRALIAASRERIPRNVAPALTDWADRTYRELERQLSDYTAALARGDASVLQTPTPLGSLPDDLARRESLAQFFAGFEKIRAQVQTQTPRPDIAAGFATSMEKILPRNLPLVVETKTAVEVRLARNEKESFQVLVAPFGQDLRRVSVRSSDLRSAEGQSLAASVVTAVPVGYVQTKSVPPYGSACVGWWPDPILDFLSTADIASGDVQSFWVRVRAPRDQKPGRYQGKLQVLVDGTPAFAFDLAVRIDPFRLPDVSPLPMAITFAPHDHPKPDTKEQQDAWRKSESYPIRAWRKHKLAWADFLADYYITFDSLYHHELPDAEVLAHLHQQGRLDKYNLGYFDYVGSQPDAVEQWKAKNLPRFRAAYAQAKQLGVLDHAYLYGCDEVTADLFPRVQQAAALLKAEFPEVPVMTTTYDHSFGQDSVIKSMDSFCPLTPKFDATIAAKARTAGKQVWWYICCGPHHPHANMFIEYPAIEGRVLMGAMTAKYRPDGFLYYQISIWNSEKPITSGPFTDWDPRSWTTYHGDGSWTCVGPGGTPLATIRLENFRDGLEDFAYVRLLEQAIAKVEASPTLRTEKAAWLQQAKSLLAVPEDLVQSKTKFTADPQVVYRYRAALADALVAAGVE
jgi:hypothetical protein